MPFYKKWIGLIFLFLILGSANAKINILITETQKYPYHDSFLYLKEKSLTQGKKAPLVILLNAVSIPSVDAFDVPGYSLMSRLAYAGYDVWGIDFINQGHAGYSKKYPLYAKNAVSQLHAALQHIYHVNGNKSTAILGWSWGSLVAAEYAIAYPSEVNHLIFDAAMYSSVTPAMQKMLAQSTDIPETQQVPWSMVQHHWKTMLPEQYQAENIPAMQKIKKIYCQINNNQSCTVTRFKTQMQDLTAAWTGKPLYDASKITTPSLVIYGSNDFFVDSQLFEQLTHTPYKEQVVINHGSHWLLYEKNRELFYQFIVNFLKMHE